MYIYKITNLINGKVYIGQTKNNPLYRWHQHIKGYNNSNSILKKAINKYSKDSFTFEVIAKSDIIAELNSLERNFIKEFNSLAPNGYNLESGGREDYKLSEESILKMRKAKLGKKASNSTKLKMSEAQKGRKHTPESLEKMSKSQKKLQIAKGKTPSNARSVYGQHIETGQGWFFKTLSHATFFGFDISNISAVCHGRLKTHKKYMWKFI